MRQPADTGTEFSYIGRRALAMVYLAFGLLFALAPVGLFVAGRKSDALILLGPVVVSFVLLVSMSIKFFTMRVTLSDFELTLSSAFGKKTMPFASVHTIVIQSVWRKRWVDLITVTSAHQRITLSGDLNNFALLKEQIVARCPHAALTRP